MAEQVLITFKVLFNKRPLVESRGLLLEIEMETNLLQMSYYFDCESISVTANYR